MIQNVLTRVGGVGVYDAISICLFFVVFGGTLIWAFLLKKPFLDSMSDLPLEDEPNSSSTEKPGPLP